MSYDATFASELRQAKASGYKPKDANTVARQRAKPAKDLRRFWSFYVPTDAEVREVERIEAELAVKAKR